MLPHVSNFKVQSRFSVFSLMSRVPICLSRDFTNVPTFKLAWNYLNLARRSSIGINIDALPYKLNSSILKHRTTLSHRYSCQVNIIKMKWFSLWYLWTIMNNYPTSYCIWVIAASWNSQIIWLLNVEWIKINWTC